MKAPQLSAARLLVASLAASCASLASAKVKDCPPVVELARSAALEAEFGVVLNRRRSAAGLSAVAPDKILASVVMKYACLLASARHFDHVGPDGSRPQDRVTAGGYNYCLVAENLAQGQTGVAEVFADWLASKGHRENMLLDGVRDFALASIPEPESAGADGGHAVSARSLSDLMTRYGSETPDRGGAEDRSEASNRSGHRYWVLLLGRRC